MNKINKQITGFQLYLNFYLILKYNLKKNYHVGHIHIGFVGQWVNRCDPLPMLLSMKWCCMISQKIKAIAITAIELCLSEGISKLVSLKKVSQSAENSVINF